MMKQSCRKGASAKFAALLFATLLVWTASAKNAQPRDPTVMSSYTPRLSTPPLQLFLDVDNCLYRENQLSRGIESQIIQGVKAFCRDWCNLNGAQADGLYEMFGSTEEGLRRTTWKNTTTAQLKSLLRQYYNISYAKVDVSELLPSRHSSASSTGYSHSLAQQRTIRKVLAASPSLVTSMSSNSPVFHVKKVIQALGLCHVFDSKDILTPDDCASTDIPTRSKDTIFPTKVSAEAYFGKLRYPKDQVALVDDSSTNLQAVQRLMKGYHVSEKQSLLEALAKTWGWLDENYEFSAIEYLKAKNKMDEMSINRDTWNTLMECLAGEISTREEKGRPLSIVDVGAGLLSMHRLLLEEEGRTTDLPSLTSIFRSKGLVKDVKQINYVAYEPNEDLRKPCVEYLLGRGFSLKQEYGWDTRDAKGHVREIVFEKQAQDGLKTEISLRFWDFRQDVTTTHDNPPSPDLIVGCCFADLLPPDELTRSILRCFLSKPQTYQSSALLYFPITFWGITQFAPSLPAAESGTQVTPSDTQAFAAYSKILDKDFEHSLNPQDLIESTVNYGGCLISQGSSDWKIDAAAHEFLWRTMLYFFAMGAAPELQSLGYDATSWIRRAWDLRPSVRASNVDLLLRLPYIGKWEKSSETKKRDRNPDKSGFLQIEFSAPKEVAFVSKSRPKLEPGEIRIESLCSLISSGTELKIFHGSFDEAALDVNIDSMEGQRMSFPLAYGYCLVGRVIECGDGVDTESLNGKLVFTFSPHASEVVANADSVHLIPEGIDPFDAIFMPSVETALSIVHDANPRLGEKVIVFGQGLIGLLTTSLLSSMILNLQSPTLTTVDTIPERLALSAWLGSQQAVPPYNVGSCGDFDIAIEASGNYQGLQSAIDCTRNGGRVIIASWYGSEQVSLKLGIEFHRSHKTIRTSQVSELPAELRETWTKKRRFDLVWHILKDLRPSKLLTRKASPSEAKDMYEGLSRGDQVSVAFDYTRP
eukprot:scaffold1519_cov166-Amphora_coffeaeformis.AAC.19